ncbi:hypothetical protein [Myroides odoratimimus]|uniref:hypothetical protein n=1 Tax=Myroides odoratimimus TaxID=76832 RepID=UPI002576047F|nr:hypothetical protein [Myroides odoratimimus]MDM1514626.1 hypothetical protein [Myroides odoratimimus]
MRAFRNNSAFQDYMINTICDQIFNLVPEAVTQRKFMLTGLAAYFFQRGDGGRPLQNIVFKTTDTTVYNTIMTAINRLNLLNVVKYNSRILCEAEGQITNAYIEIWLDPGTTKVVDLNGLICEEYSSIKNELL